MAVHGTVSAFDAKIDSWTSYVERLDFYFEANDIVDDGKKRAIFLTTCGADTYQLLKNLIQPAKPSDKTFAELVKVLEDHYSPAPNPIVSRYKFHSAVRAKGETVSCFVSRLKELSIHCNFGGVLDDMLRDRLVCGVQDSDMQKRLFAIKTLTFAKAFELCQSMEMAASNASDLTLKVPTPSSPQTSSVDVCVMSRPREQVEPCSRCGSVRHKPDDCFAKELVCYFCKKIGHIQRECLKKKQASASEKKASSRRRKKTPNVNAVDEDTVDFLDDTTEYTLYHVDDNSDDSDPPVYLSVMINDAPVSMMIDSGAVKSVISQTTFKKLWPEERPVLNPCKKSLYTYTGGEVSTIGWFVTSVAYEGKSYNLPVVVVGGDGPSLLGRGWMRKMDLDLNKLIRDRDRINTVQDDLSQLLDKYAAIFSDELGTLKGITAKICVDPSVPLKFHKARPVPHALKPRVETELNRLVDCGILEPVQYADVACPIVPVVKADGVSVRICGDYSTTVNRAAKQDQYPLPKIRDLYSAVSGGEKFSKLDLSWAYQQVCLDDKSKDIATINTHMGLFRPTRLPFGINSSASIFQRAMDGIVRGIPMTVVYQDDILVSGRDDSEHFHNLEAVLRKLDAAGVRLKREKCLFMSKEVSYLGHRIDSEGIHPLSEKTKAIVDAPAPKNVSELQSFLGMLNYYSPFIPNHATVLAPLHRLLRKQTPWQWGNAEQDSFAEAKRIISSPTVLVHYDPEKDLVLSCDASPYGVGAVLSHSFPDGTEKPIAFASRTLVPAERNYSQLDKEGLAVIFGVKKFNDYLYGRHFVIYTDHKPLLGLLGEDKPTPSITSPRVQRWAVTLSAYNYKLLFRPGKNNVNADCVSRLPLPVSSLEIPLPGDVLNLMEHMSGTSCSPSLIRRWTETDPVLSTVLRYVLNGWPSHVPEPLKSYSVRRNELSAQDGILLWGSRVIVPDPGRAAILQELHDTHLGASRMKAYARSYVWWPNLDADIEETVRQCVPCQKGRKSPSKAPLHPWDWPSEPWSRIHIDHLGPFMNSHFLVVIDAHSKWIDLYPVSSLSSKTTIDKLRNSFATHGLPVTIVSDNGSSFTSSEFKDFVNQNGIRHVTSAVYHPSTNGQAERAVQIVKCALSKMTGGDLNTKVARFLLRYRNTPHSVTGRSPSELLMKRRLRERLDAVHPSSSISDRVVYKQSQQKADHDKHVKLRSFASGDSVLTRQAGNATAWLEGEVVRETGPLSYEIRLCDGGVIRRHVDHIIERSYCVDLKNEASPTVQSDRESEVLVEPQSVVSDEQVHCEVVTSSEPESVSETVPVRRSNRVSKPPDRLDL